MISDHPIQHDEWNGSYLRRLTPFIVISLVLHLIAFGSILGVSRLLGGGQGLSIVIFEPGDPGSGPGQQPLLGGLFGSERLKVFRIDFFREIISWVPPEPEPPEEITPEEIPVEEIIPVEEPEPDEEPEIEELPDENESSEELSEIDLTLELPDTDESEIPDGIEREISQPVELIGAPIAGPPGENGFIPLDGIPETPEGTGFNPKLIQPVLPDRFNRGEMLPDALGLFDVSAEDSDVLPAFAVLPWELTDIDGNTWNDEQFLGNFTIYLLADISRRHGLEEMLVWSYMMRQLVTNPESRFPPNMAIIASANENPYGFGELRVRATLERAREEEHSFGVMMMDLEGEFALNLGYAEIPQPIVVFVDYSGFVRLIMIGRVRDISNENIEATMGVISEMWQWEEEEFASLPVPLMILLNVIRDEAYVEENRLVPAPPIAHQISPSWGYPFIPGEDSTTDQE